MKPFLFNTPLPDKGLERVPQSWITFRKHELLQEWESAQVIYLLGLRKMQLVKKHANERQYILTTLSAESTIGIPAVLAH